MTDKEKLQAIREVIENLEEDDSDYTVVEAGLEDIKRILNS